MRASALLHPRPGHALLAVVAMLALIGLLSAGIVLHAQSAQATAKPPIRLAAAAGLRAALEPAIAEYEQSTGQRVEVTWGGTGTLYAQIVASNGTFADVFLAADEITINQGRADGWLEGNFPVARQSPVLAVAKGNPKNIHSIDDLLRGDVVLSMPDPDQASTGRAVRNWLEPQDRWDAVRQAARVTKPTVTDAAADVQIGAADATFVFDHMLRAGNWPELELAADLGIPGEQATASIVKNSEKTLAAQQFIDWITSPAGRTYFERGGFEVPTP